MKRNLLYTLMENAQEVDFISIKEILINDRKRVLNYSINNGHLDFDGMKTTDYFEDFISPIHLIAERKSKPGPDIILNKQKNWKIRGYCTYNEWKNIKKFQNWLSMFKGKYSEIQTVGYDIELSISGGMDKKKVLISEDEMRDWAYKGVFICPYGIDHNGRIVGHDIVDVFEDVEEDDICCPF